MKTILVSVLSLTIGFSIGYVFNKSEKSERLGTFNVQDLRYITVRDFDGFIHKGDYKFILTPNDSSIFIDGIFEEEDEILEKIHHKFTDSEKANSIVLITKN